MQFRTTDEVSHGAREVFLLIRDDMPSLVPYLADVEEITVLERRENADGSVFILNRWRGSQDKVPRVAQKFLKPQTLTWKDHATWYEQGPPRAQWRLEPTIGASLFECTGTTSVLEAGEGRCKIQIEGDLRVYPEKLPGVPKLLAGSLRGTIEQFVVNMIVPNLQGMARGVQGYFDDKKAGR